MSGRKGALEALFLTPKILRFLIQIFGNVCNMSPFIRKRMPALSARAGVESQEVPQPVLRIWTSSILGEIIG